MESLSADIGGEGETTQEVSCPVQGALSIDVLASARVIYCGLSRRRPLYCPVRHGMQAFVPPWMARGGVRSIDETADIEVGPHGPGTPQMMLSDRLASAYVSKKKGCAFLP